jgi:anti-sigma B factor antagonist
MKLLQQRHGAVTLIKPEGPLVEDGAEVFSTAAQTLMGQTLGRFVVDMSAVPFVDSAGLETLLNLTESLNNSGKVLKLCGTNKTVRQVLELTEIDSLFDHFEDVNSAVRSFL